MLIKRTPFLLGLLAIILLPIWIFRINWYLTADKATATVAFNGKEITGQIHRNYSVLFFSANNLDTIFFNTSDNDLYAKGEKLTILYQPEHPEEAHVANFRGIWMEPLIYSLLALIIIGIIFLHPEIIPRNNGILLQKKAPFVRAVAGMKK